MKFRSVIFCSILIFILMGWLGVINDASAETCVISFGPGHDVYYDCDSGTITQPCTNGDPNAQPGCTIWGGCEASCFPAGTKISMIDGTAKNIEDVKVGDTVLSYDTSVGEKVAGRVLELESPVRNHMCRINFQDGNVLELTDEHPVYTSNGWKSINPMASSIENAKLFVSKLESGDEVLSLSGGFSKVENLNCWQEKIQTYNLKTIEDHHTFYADKVLVHNKNDGPSCSTGSNSGTNSCTYNETVDWGICDLKTGMQKAVQVRRTKSCSWSCSYNTCNSSSCSDSCNPGSCVDDLATRPCGTCGDNVVNDSVRPKTGNGLCQGITPAYPNPGVNDHTWGRPRTTLAYNPDPADPFNPELPGLETYNTCNPLQATYIDLDCEECDEGFCGSDTCYGPVHGPEYACRLRPGNCGDGVKQPAEACDDPGGTCNSTCTATSYCGDGEVNQPFNGAGEYEECDAGQVTDECNDSCQFTDDASRGYIEEILPE